MWGGPDAGGGVTAAPLGRFDSLRTTDVDAFRSAAGGLLSTHSIAVPRDPATPFRGAVRSAAVADLGVVYLEQGTPIDVDILDRIDYYDLMIAVAGSNRLELVGADGGAVIEGGVAAVLSPAMRARMRMDGSYRQLHLRLERAAVQERLEALAGRPVGGPVVFEVGMDLGAPGLRSWSGALRSLLRDLDDEAGLATDPVMARHWRDLLITGLLVSHRHNQSELLHDRDADRVHPRTFQRALDHIEAGLSGPLSVPDVAAHVGVSVRSLQRAFQDRLALSPSAYILGERLDRVRAELVTPDSGRTVTETAYDWGFTHPSRFAGMYRRRFGETPSQTRARVAGR
ncbi:helix-turn-helix transcriptional regulator [Tsukamurella pseudospumae]|uniref:AraC family transcriptional regulator n=1 Tax=Tsukamurella pseudospumae TaxID=239498 RepID=A0A138A8P2_9ACTN|nr:AraC family transcriptional regulator [Tsukamurella pseudospumae]KXO99269.1 AraC family transcriptional regulator [Tsukamurella pseudospumae]KXP06851.1 AraC family transcriptional regulator [Tsukamurella pseudospumae]